MSHKFSSVLYFLCLLGFLLPLSVIQAINLEDFHQQALTYEERKQLIKFKNTERNTVSADVVSEFVPRMSLIIAPHPDDEVLCCSLTIEKKIKAGEKIVVLFLTDGDAKGKGDFEGSLIYGAQRRQESVVAMKSLGIVESDLLFLNFPDGILADLPFGGRMHSPYTNRDETGPFSYAPGIAYNRANLNQLVAHAINTYKPDEIYVPSPEKDIHSDHQVGGQIIRKYVQNLRTLSAPAVHEYQIHGREIETASDTFNRSKFEWINLFKTQMHDPHHRDFLSRFAYTNEWFVRWTD